MIRFFFYKIGQFIVNRISLRASYAFAQLLSDLQYTFSFTDRRSVRSNMRKILGRQDVDERLVRDVFRNFGKYLVDFFRMVRFVDDDFVRRQIKLEGMEYLKAALEKGKGVIIVTAHIGNWELGGIVMNKLGFPLLAVALPHTHRSVNELFNTQRERSGVTVVPPNVAVRRCLEKLKDNESVALVADRDFGPHGLLMDFFSHKTLLPKGPAVLAMKTGAAIVVSFMIRNSDDTFTLSFHPPVYPGQLDQGTVPDDVLKGVIGQYIKVVEEKIRQFPGQWLMFREFWAPEHLQPNRNDTSAKNGDANQERFDESFVTGKGRAN